jgi:Double zinc ribbon
VARLPLPQRFRRRRGQQEAAGAAQSQPRRPVRRAASPGALRRERRAILKAREELLRDLGGLAMEMYRREQFREDLLTEHAAEIANLEARLHELDSMLAAAAAGRRTTASRCDCGAPIIWGSHFCANCGRPVGEQAVVSCANCGHPLPADAAFCPSCGRAAGSSSDGESPDGRAKAKPDEASPVEPAAVASPEQAAERPDRWEE